MTLSEAVRGANTPENLTRVLEEIARRYMVARTEEKKFTLAKGEIRDACVEALKRLETDTYQWEFDSKRFRAKVFQINRVKATKALADLLMARGLGYLVKVEIKIDDALLYNAIRLNKIGIEEIRSLSEISHSQGFRITELKPGKEEDAEE